MAKKTKAQPLYPLLAGLLAEIKKATSVTDASATLLKQQEKIQRLEAKVKELETLVKGYAIVSGQKVEICPECQGAGAYVINEEVEECDRCDTSGWILISP